MEHFVAYHSVEVMGRDYAPGKRFSFYSRKGEKLLRAAIGATAWVVVGTRVRGRTTYRLAGRYTPDNLEPQGDGNWVIEGSGTPLKPPVELTNLPWFAEMKREQSNFSLGFNRIRNESVIAALDAILPGPPSRQAGAAKSTSGPGNSPRITIPEELTDDDVYMDGAVMQLKVNRYERDRSARAACIAAHGPRCSACGIDFGRVYGRGFAGLITVHHLRPLAQIKARHRIDPVKDLCPLCPNCHFIVHQRNPPYTPAEVRAMLAKAR
jgi:5-methylcytosine-specific restriction protein A